MIYFLIVFILYGIYYLYTSKADLHYQSSELNMKILEKCKIITKQYFLYTPYIFFGLLQAYCASIIKDGDQKLHFLREYIDFGDFGLFALDWGWYDGKITEKEAKETEGRNLVVVLSGLTASRVEPYIQNFFSKFCQNKSDWRIVLYNDRLYNNRIYKDPNRQILPKEGYFHHIEDFRRVLEYIAKIHNKSNIYAVGHSFGANNLARYLGQCGSNQINPLIKAGVCICNPFDFQVGAKFIHDSLSDSYILKHRRRIVGEKLNQFFPLPKHIHFDYEAVKQSKKSIIFDELFTRRLFGAPSVDLHYLSVNSANYLEFIKIPTLLLGTYDDPVINYSVYPKSSILRNGYLISLMTRVGGHMSWFEGIIKPQRWYSKPVIEYLEAVSSLLQ